jgi:Tol biopolymer transport system component
MCYLFRGYWNNCDDIFVHDRLTSETIRVSVASDGTQANERSRAPAISDNGLFITFSSKSSNLVIGDTNFADDVFVHNRMTGETVLVSVSSDGSQGNFGAESPSISADGRFVAFGSWSLNLILGDLNNVGDIFVHDREGVALDLSISGHVTDSEGNPLPGVSVSAGYGFYGVTDSQGDYTLSAMLSGVFRLTPSLAGYHFSPSWRIVSVPPDRIEVDFTERNPMALHLPIIIR